MIEICGDFSNNHVHCSISLKFLRKLMNIEYNPFSDAFIKTYVTVSFNQVKKLNFCNFYIK